MILSPLFEQLPEQLPDSLALPLFFDLSDCFETEHRCGSCNMPMRSVPVNN